MTFDILKMSKDEKRHTKRFTPEEDETIMKEVEAQGDFKKALSILEQKFAGQHSRRAISDRYKEYLNKNMSSWTRAEDKLLYACVQVYGTHWSRITAYFIGRSAIQLRNRYRQITALSNWKFPKRCKQRFNYSKTDEEFIPEKYDNDFGDFDA